MLSFTAFHSVCCGVVGAASEAPLTSDGIAEVSVDAGTEYQVIDNFGASDCWSAQKIGGWSDANRNRVADLLFSIKDGIGLSCWRFNLGGGLDYAHMGEGSWRTVETFETDEGRYDWTRQANERWFLAAAKARGVEQFVAFANSPPMRMTRNGKTYCDDNADSTNLKEWHEGQFARYLADIVRFFRDNADESQRIDFDWVSPINEPQWPWTGNSQEGCRASNDDIKAVIAALDTELRARNLDTKILAPESGILYGMRAEHRGTSKKYGAKVGDYLDEFCGDPNLKEALGGVICCHSYRCDFVPEELVPERLKFKQKFDEYPGWRYWQTEYCVMQGPENQGGGGRDLTMKTALDVARVIHCDLVFSNASAWQWWTAVSPCDYKDGLVYTDYQKPGDSETIYPAKTLWAFGNYSRFVRPGAKRIALHGANNIYALLGSAYKSASGEQVIVVFVNMAEAEKRVSLRIDGIPGTKVVRQFTPWITSEHDELKQYPAVEAGEPYAVPARSVVTLVGAFEDK